MPARMISQENMLWVTSKYVKTTYPAPNPTRNLPKPNPDDLLIESPVSNSSYLYITFVCCL